MLLMEWHATVFFLDHGSIFYILCGGVLLHVYHELTMPHTPCAG